MTVSSPGGAVLAAAVRGATHAVEADHVAGISSLTSRYGSSRTSALAGVCFGLGHVALVVAWLAVAYAVFGRTSFDPAVAAAGKVGAGLLLAALGATMAVAGARTLGHRHGDGVTGDATNDPADDARGASDAGLHVHLPGVTLGADHDHGDAPSTRRFLRTGVVGALFTLSPPLSMIAFASAVVPDYGGVAAALIVLAYAVAISVTMGTVGALVGSAFAAARLRDGRVHGGAQVVGAALVCGVAGHLLWTTVPTLL